MNYLYNGVELPKLPEWDIAAYPYAVMVYNHSTESYEIHVTSAPLTRYTRSSPYTGEALTALPRADYPHFNVGVFDHENGSWGNRYYAEYTFNILGEPNCWHILNQNAYVASTVIWSNYNIFDEDGTVFMAASDPVPQLNPAALMQGFATMLSLRK
jgi:hypothetical protein